jgi:hypothetical protein
MTRRGNRIAPTATLLVLALLLLPARPARADEYLESKTGRSGFAIGFGIGPGVFGGAGEFGDLLGTGVDATLRVGTSAGPKTLWILQIDSVAYLAEDVTEEKHTNVHSTLTLGMQYYFRDLLWCKGGAGVATIAERQKRGAEAETLSTGGAVMASCGFDAVRRGSLVLDVESTLGTGIYADGVISQFGVKLALNWY